MLTGISSFACLNEYHIDKNGKSTSWMESAPVFFSDHDSFASKKFLAKYDLDNTEQYDFKEQSDIAVNLAYLGKYKRSLEILIKLQKEHPAEYSIAANLGTLYELNGHNETALKFIKKGIALNPFSHGGSEWLHVRILEAKMAVKNNPSWLTGRSVAGTGITFDSKKTGSKEREKALDNILYQLQERVPFTPFPDPIMADIFNELGDLYAVEFSAEAAYIAYELSSLNKGDALYHLSEKKAKLAPVLNAHKIPVPDWHIHYASVYENSYGAYFKDKAAEAAKNPGLTIEKVSAYKNMFEKFTGQEEKKSSSLLPAVTAAAVSSLLIIFFIYRRHKKRKEADFL